MGSATFAPNVFIKGWGTAVGPREGKGPYGCFFDVVEQDDGYPQVVVLIEEPPEELRKKVMSAAIFCPNRVITVED